MKLKRGFFVIVFLFLFLDGAVAISSDLGESYTQGETVIAQISGEILWPISAEQVKLKRRHVEIGLDYGVKKIGGKQFVWFITPMNAGNYTLVIEKIITRVDGVVKEFDYEKNFVVGEERAEYYIKPGAVFAVKDFSVKAYLNGDFEKTISIDFPEERDVNLRPGENTIGFSLDNVYGNQNVNILVGDYSIPVYIIGKEEVIIPPENESEVNESEDEEPPAVNESDGNVTSEVNISFSINPKKIKSVVLSGGEQEYYFEIFNYGNETIKEISFDYDEEIFLIENEGEIDIEPNESIGFNLKLLNAGGGSVREIVGVSSGEFEDYLLVSIDYTSEEQDIETEYFREESGETSLYYCSDIPGGKQCSAEEICTGQEIVTIDAENGCCTGECEKQGGGSKAWIGYLIIGVVVLILIILFVKYRKGGKRGDVMKEKVADAEKAFSGRNVPIEKVP